jgi:hypothetical protein
LNPAPFLNQFDQPVYFLGLPFDLSFILPELGTVSPPTDIHVEIFVRDRSDTILYTIFDADVSLILPDGTSLDGFINSLLIDLPTLPVGAVYITAEITI